MRFLKKLALSAVLLSCLIGIQPAVADNLATLAKGGAGGWLNVTRPITEDDMKGRLVLLDFWTYGCVNCMQIVPDLKKLEQTFGDKLLIVGVHSAKFKGEQGNARILSAAKRFGLEHPVINDSDFAVWNNFKVEAWPTLILLGTDGQEISRYEGEGHLAELDKDIGDHVNAVTLVAKQAPVDTLILKEQKISTLCFPARIKQVGDSFYIADSGNDRIIAVDKDGKIIKKFEGLHHPRGFVVKGNMLYVADTDGHSVVQFDILGTSAQKTVGGDGKRGRTWASPWDLDVAADGNILIAMAGVHQLDKLNLTNNALEPFAGNGRESIKDNIKENAELAQPSGLSVATDGAVYFVDAESSALRVVKDDNVKTLIGTGLFDFGLVDGTYPEARLQHPQGLFVKDKKIYIADTYNNAIRTYDIESGQLATIKTSGETLNEPGSIWVGDEYALIADTNNNRIVKMDLKSANLSVFPIK